MIFGKAGRGIWKRSSVWFSSVAAAGRKTPVTQAIFLAILVVGLATEVRGESYWPLLVQRYGWDLTTLEQGHLYAAWVGLFFSSSPEEFYGILILLVLTVGGLEYRWGTRLAVLGFFLVGPLASMIDLILLWPFSIAGIAYVRLALFTPDVGSSTACLVCLGILLSLEKGRWRNILLWLVLTVLFGLVFQHAVYSFDHLVGYLSGLGTGAVLGRWKRRKQTNRYLAGKTPGRNDEESK